MTKINQSIVLPDRRRLGFDEYGPADGKPLFYFHGTPSSRKDWHALGNAGLPEKLGVRVIVADRPVWWLLFSSMRKSWQMIC
jgi:pimeloyl-ACP methyl ester carboxylesterase